MDSPATRIFCALLAISFASAAPAELEIPSQSDDPAQKDVEILGEYVVTDQKPAPFTGRNVDISRGIDDVQPYYIFNRQTIEQSRATNAEDFLKNFLTMDTTAQSNSQQYASVYGNTSTVGLRGLGASQTLILIDGRRTASVSFEGNTEQPDINGVPLAAIDRIEVLPSSASAIYGGSAVGGVINIVLKKDYVGGEIRYAYETPFDTDTPARTLDASWGFVADGGKTHVMIAAHDSDGKPITLQDRQYLIERGIATILKNEPSFLYAPTSPFFGSSPNIALYPRSYAPPGGAAVTNPENTTLSLKNGASLNSPITYVPLGAAPGADLSSAYLANAGAYDLSLAPGTGEYGLQDAIGTTARDKSFMVSVRQDIFLRLEAFADVSTESNAGLSQYSVFSNANWVVPATAPTNPFQENVYVNFPSAFSEPLISDSLTASVTVGVVARLPGDWKSELDYTWSRNAFEFAEDNDDSTGFETALANGTVNPFVDTLAHPLNLSSYLEAVAYSGASTVSDFAVRASGPVASLPAGRPNLTLGFEHRKEGNANENLDETYSVTTANDEHETFFGQAQSIESAYAEAGVPVIAARDRIPLLAAFELQLAARSEAYAVGTGTSYYYIFPNRTPPLTGTSGTAGVHATARYDSTNPTIGLKYSPVEDVTFRASWGTAFLPPTYQQLLPNPTAGMPSTIVITDPQTGKTYSGYTTVSGGNPNLLPQHSKNWDLGAIWEPKWELLRGLRFDAEFFQIKEFDVITSPPNAQFIVANQSKYPGRITRDPITGLITQINLSSINLYGLETEGWDLSLDYRKPTGLGIFDLHALETIQEHYKQQISIMEPTLEYVGYVAEGGPAKTKANATLTWIRGRWEVGWTASFFDGYKQYGAPGDPANQQQGRPLSTAYTEAQGGNSISSQLTHDAFFQYTFGKTLTGRRWKDALALDWTIQVGIRNLFNTLPPFDAYYAPYFYSPYGDPRLRDFWVSVRRDF